MNIKIKKHLLLYKNYKLKCSIGKSGITSFKKERDFATPKGTFKLGLLYYRKDRIRPPKCKIRTNKMIKAFTFHDIRNHDNTKYIERYKLKSFMTVDEFKNKLKYLNKEYNIINSSEISNDKISCRTEKYIH